MADSIAVRFKRAARTGALSWIAALPVLAVGMMCFWAQRDAMGMSAQLLKFGALLVPVAFIVPSAVCDVVRGTAVSALSVVIAIGRGLLAGVIGLAVGSIMLFVEALRPESALGFFADAFTMGHLIAAGLPALIAFGLWLWTSWGDNDPRRLVRIAVVAVAAALGVAAWWWSTGVAFEAMRYANADNTLLLAQSMTLAAIAISCIASAAICAWRSR